jgi:hypothetical protein
MSQWLPFPVRPGDFLLGKRVNEEGYYLRFGVREVDDSTLYKNKKQAYAECGRRNVNRVLLNEMEKA